MTAHSDILHWFREPIPTPWIDQAACRDAPLDMFFAERGSSHHTYIAVRKICDNCTVQHDCLSYALKINATHGIWGGTTPKERRAICRTTEPVHGRWTYMTGCRCDVCRQANTDYRRIERARRREGAA